MSGPSRTRAEQKQDLKWHRAALQQSERYLRDSEHRLKCTDHNLLFYMKKEGEAQAEIAALRLQLINASSAAETRELELQELRRRMAEMPRKWEEDWRRKIKWEEDWRRKASEEIDWRKEELRELRGRAEDSSDSEADLEADSEGQTERADTDGGQDSDDGGEDDVSSGENSAHAEDWGSAEQQDPAEEEALAREEDARLTRLMTETLTLL
jgi:hypothetical protein